jgi:hypothetical protein
MFVLFLFAIVSLQCNIFNFAVILTRHVEGQKLDRTVWSLSTFHAYVSYHVKVGVLFVLMLLHSLIWCHILPFVRLLHVIYDYFIIALTM